MWTPTRLSPNSFSNRFYGPATAPTLSSIGDINRDGSLKTDFELNAARFDGRSILVTGNNFGCGSSREHAVWALLQDGYAVIIAPWKTIKGARLPGFADIFRNNAVKNGLLAIELPEADVARIFQIVTATPGLEATVDLPGQTVTLPRSGAGHLLF
jgi:3-isopropylmalate/(R)-2-methylmalate dehydratase small subunit